MAVPALSILPAIGWAPLGERVGARRRAGVALITAGCVLMATARRRPRRAGRGAPRGARARR